MQGSGCGDCARSGEQGLAATCGGERAHGPERERERGGSRKPTVCDGESKDKTRESCSPANTESTAVSVPRKNLQPLPHHHQDYQHVLGAGWFQHTERMSHMTAWGCQVPSCSRQSQQQLIILAKGVLAGEGGCCLCLEPPTPSTHHQILSTHAGTWLGGLCQVIGGGTGSNL